MRQHLYHPLSLPIDIRQPKALNQTQLIQLQRDTHAQDTHICVGADGLVEVSRPMRRHDVVLATLQPR